MTANIAVYEQATGRLVSTGSVAAPVAILAARGLAAKAFAFDVQHPTKRWNPATLGFDDVAPPRATLTPRDFLDRFTIPEREDLFDARRNGEVAAQNRLGAFFEYVQMSDGVDLDDAYIVAGVTDMEAAGLIAAGRAAQILGA